MSRSNKVFKGAILTVAMRWSDRTIGLVSTIVLARLLVPEDFGVVAMAMLVVGLVDILLNLGVNQVLIHDRSPEKSDYDTAWTLRLLQSCVVALLIFFTAPIAANFFDNDEISNVLRFMAVTVVVSSLENIGIIDFQKRLEFDKDFKFFFFRRLAGFTVTITLAFILQSYWAMVIGSFAGRLAGVALSYYMSTFRPELSLRSVKKIWSFSQWVLIRNIGGYFDTKIDRIIIGRQLNADTLGGYTIAGEIAALPTTELLAPIGRVLFPAFVEKRHDKEAFRQRVSLAIGVQALAALPACIGLAFIAEDLVAVVLGSRWVVFAPLVQIMAISNLVTSLSHACGYTLLTLGRVKFLAVLAWLNAFVFILFAVLLSSSANAESFALMRLFVICVGTSIVVVTVVFSAKVVTICDLVRQMARPSFAIIVMYVSLFQLQPYLSEYDPLLSMFLETVFGAAVYTIMIWLLWLVFGKPEGAEAYLLKNIRYQTQK